MFKAPHFRQATRLRVMSVVVTFIPLILPLLPSCERAISLDLIILPNVFHWLQAKENTYEKLIKTELWVSNDFFKRVPLIATNHRGLLLVNGLNFGWSFIVKLDLWWSYINFLICIKIVVRLDIFRRGRQINQRMGCILLSPDKRYSFKEISWLLICYYLH